MFKKVERKEVRTNNFELQQELEEYFKNNVRKHYKRMKEDFADTDDEKEFIENMEEHDLILASSFSYDVLKYLRDKANKND